MPPTPILNLGDIDAARVLFDREAIRARNPHRYEMEFLDRIVHFDLETCSIAAVKSVRNDEFWVRGHFPDRPVLPGVLMLEAAGQLCSFYCYEVSKDSRVMGFAAAHDVRFRGQVVPGDDLLLLGRVLRLSPKQGARFQAQGYAHGELVFECELLGMYI